LSRPEPADDPTPDPLDACDDDTDSAATDSAYSGGSTSPSDDTAAPDSGEPNPAESNGHALPLEAQDDTADRLDKQLAASAYKKTLAGEPLTDKERSALKRYEKAKEEKLRWQYYASIPHKHWKQMSGRQAKVINEQAERYGLPFAGPTVNLSAVVHAFHDFLAANAVKLAAEDDPLMQGTGSPALERHREEKAALARLDRLERERQLLPRDMAREGLGRIAAVLRGIGESLQRQYGPGALEILNEGLEDAQQEIDRSFGDMDGSLEDSNGW